MRVAFSRGLLVIAVLLLVLGHGTAGKRAVAGSLDVSNAKMWLDKAVIEQRCPLSPVNVPAAILRSTSSDVLRQRISITEDTLQIEGTPNPDHIVIRAGEAPGTVRVVFNGKYLGSFGPVARILVQGGGGDDVLVVEPEIGLPVRLEGGTGDNCLQSGQAAIS